MSQKRKLEEYHDPDYPQNDASKRTRDDPTVSEEKITRIKQIINREFNREVQFREEQLEEIDSNLAKAKELLHQIRYTVVSDYYSKQNLQYSEIEAAAARGPSLFENEADGPQMPMHPAIKKIIGKKPKTYDELLRVRPTVREAAKTAKTTIKEKSRTKKEEKRIQRMIKQRGIVIDHSKEDENNGNNASSSSMLDIRDPNGPIKVPRHIEPSKVDNPIAKLNSARLNNQTKHLIVVGNTSKYVGDEKASDNSSHKWLIYVQAKSVIPIEKFVTKVRFFLHKSYRPNDVVDVDSPPFQLARRGWGEFPVRLQLFFDPRIQQKPVQLVHNLVLDKTLSGLQTMGAETLVEIWLRTEHIIPAPPSPCPSPILSRPTETVTKTSKGLLSPTKAAEIMNPKAEIDDNLFDFLDKIESPAICADIEKIQPTFMDSPLVDSLISRKPLGLPPSRSITEAIMRLSDETSHSQAHAPVPIKNTIKIEKEVEVEADITQEKSHIQEVKPSVTPQRIPDKPAQLNAQNNASTTNQTKPIMNGRSQLIANPHGLEKKLVQFIDKEGNVKLLQMLIAPKGAVQAQAFNQMQHTSNGLKKLVPINGDNLKTVRVLSKLASKQATNGANGLVPANIKCENTSPAIQLKSAADQPERITPRPASTIRSNGPLKNQVIHKEGKVYIIDPLQTKLRQEQKKQISLLKPQISLLKPIVQNDNLGNCIRNNANKVFSHTSIATDHDYTTRLNPDRPPANTVTITRPHSQIRPTFRQPNTITVRNFPNPANFIPSKVPELKKGNFIPVKINHKPVIALMKKQRREYRRELEQKFQNTPFDSIRCAVEFLLRRLPMVNNTALENDYRMAFPFVIATWAEFRKTIPIKLKALEFLRAKYILTNLSQYPKFKTVDLWTTKEIILFARHHAYTPVINSMAEHQNVIRKNKLINEMKTEEDTSLTDLVKNEIEKEQLHYQTLTPNHRICDWVEEAWKGVSTHQNATETIIDVDGLDDENQSKPLIKESPVKNFQGKMWLSIDEKLEKEAYLVNGMCQEIGIRLQPEEIQRDVIHPTAQTVMAQTLRLFIQDVVRRSIAFKMKNNKEKSSNNISLHPHDVRTALNSKPEFDFLTNKYFATIKAKDLLELG